MIPELLFYVHVRFGGRRDERRWACDGVAERDRSGCGSVSWVLPAVASLMSGGRARGAGVRQPPDRGLGRWFRDAGAPFGPESGALSRSGSVYAHYLCIDRPGTLRGRLLGR